MKKIIFLIFLGLVISSGCINNISHKLSTNEPLEGPFKVVRVIDGDTLELNNSEKLRLSGINAPETGECYYEEAKNRLSDLVLDKDVFLEKDITDKGKYGRLLRYVYVDDLFVNSLLVEEGYVKVYDKYKYDTKYYSKLKQAENEPRKDNLGVWSCEDIREKCAYVGSKNSNIYHLPDCKYAKKIIPENLICFKTKEEAEKLGYEPCGTCKP